MMITSASHILTSFPERKKKEIPIDPEIKVANASAARTPLSALFYFILVIRRDKITSNHKHRKIT